MNITADFNVLVEKSFYTEFIDISDLKTNVYQDY
jgi:hypothetical protein